MKQTERNPELPEARQTFRPGVRFLQFYFVVGVLILGALLYLYSRVLMRQLESEIQVRSRIYARFMSRAMEVPSPSSPELDIIFEEVVKKIDFPVIVTDSAGNPIPGGYRNLPEKHPSPERLKRLIRRLDAEHAPIEVFTLRGPDTLRLQEIHYGLSSSARILRLFPFVQLSLLVLFLLLGIWGISVHNRRERERIWTGLAKETAHQLATPLSSFAAWLDVLRSSLPSTGQGPTVIGELSQDLDRMKEILERFSRIGHPPELKVLRIGSLLERTATFVQRRASRNIEFKTQLWADPEVRVDEVLISWTIENLLRNSVDAIGAKPGRIRIATALNNGILEITVTDSGEGIDPGTIREIFKPGVTTKKYGWGVGLTLAKRIVEEYHHGRLFVKESRPRHTVFAVHLPVAEST